MNTQPKMTREQWLNATANIICSEIISPNTDIPKPKIRISVGWPHASKASHSTILGQCFPREWSHDQTNEIFISPTQGANDSLTVLSTLVHELIHAYDNCQNGHKAPFRNLAIACGLTGRMTSTQPSAELAAQLTEYIEMFGEIPHAQLDTSKQKKQKGRQLKVSCSNCEFKFNTSQKQIDSIQVWDCPACLSAHSLAQN